MKRWLVALGLGLLVASVAGAADSYSIKQESIPVPKELKEPIGKLLTDKAVRLADGKGTVLAEVWFRKELPAKSGRSKSRGYRDLEESTVLGAVRFVKPMEDFRKQKIAPGVYTLRLGFQPMDGDHMGTAPYPEFCLLIPADEDQKPDTIPTKELQELSAKAAGGSHPAVFLLFPGDKPEEQPRLVDKGNNRWALNWTGGDAKNSLAISLNLIGHAD